MGLKCGMPDPASTTTDHEQPFCHPVIIHRKQRPKEQLQIRPIHNMNTYFFNFATGYTYRWTMRFTLHITVKNEVCVCVCDQISIASGLP